MSSPSAPLRRLLAGVALTGALLLAGCSGFTPLYGEAGIGQRELAFRYAAPASRLDQIIYQHLKLRLGTAATSDAPLVTIATTRSARKLTRSNVSRPATQREMVVTARVTVTASDGTIAYETTRSAAALYTTDSQALAASESEREAAERAATELAETIRLTLLGALARPVS